MIDVAANTPTDCAAIAIRVRCICSKKKDRKNSDFYHFHNRPSVVFSILHIIPYNYYNAIALT